MKKGSYVMAISIVDGEQSWGPIHKKYVIEITATSPNIIANTNI